MPADRVLCLATLGMVAGAGCGGGGAAPARDTPAAMSPAAAPGPAERTVVGGPAAAAATVRGDCAPDAPLCLGWPLDGQPGRDWFVNNYLDLDPGPGLADYTGATGAAAKTYDGHAGLDIDIPDFRAMDAGVVIHAVADGTVVGAADGFFDRNTAWPPPPGCNSVVNFVAVQHETGVVVQYLHMRKGSVMVARGQRVMAGAPLGLVGSSGCSSAPHVHLEARDAGGRLLDPNTRRMFAAAPAYDPPIALLAASVSTTRLTPESDLMDPPPAPASVPPASTIGVGALLSSAHAGDSVTFRFLRPDGTTLAEPNVAFHMAYRRARAVWNLALGGETGDWKIAVLVNGVEATRVTVPVR